jgi:hypothetical protein
MAAGLVMKSVAGVHLIIIARCKRAKGRLGNSLVQLPVHGTYVFHSP